MRPPHRAKDEKLGVRWAKTDIVFADAASRRQFRRIVVQRDFRIDEDL